MNVQKLSKILSAFAAFAGLGLLLSGCAHRVVVQQPIPPTTHEVLVAQAPPAPIAEAVPVSPGTEYVWTAGHYAWRGDKYVWVPGRYERRPRPDALWDQGHWEQRRHGWYWVEGRWR
ncbi:MAG TPA: hypothetical protein VGE41_02375 [Verrucomicrobiae bacterium]|jgi:hypothetical protein